MASFLFTEIQWRLTRLNKVGDIIKCCHCRFAKNTFGAKRVFLRHIKIGYSVLRPVTARAAKVNAITDGDILNAVPHWQQPGL